jgi:hypothetical protein
VGEDDNANEQKKSAYSDALKRAAVKFGIGRFLYSLPKMYAQTRASGKSFVMQKGEENRLRSILERFLAGKPIEVQKEPEPKPAKEKVVDPPVKKVSQDEVLDAMSATVVSHLVSLGLFTGPQNAVAALGKFIPKKDTVERFEVKAKAYRLLRESGKSPDEAASIVNSGTEEKVEE